MKLYVIHIRKWFHPPSHRLHQKGAWRWFLGDGLKPEVVEFPHQHCGHQQVWITYDHLSLLVMIIGDQPKVIIGGSP